MNATHAMVRSWVQMHRGDLEGVARWMAYSLRIGSLPACRALVTEAMQGGAQ